MSPTGNICLLEFQFDCDPARYSPDGIKLAFRWLVTAEFCSVEKRHPFTGGWIHAVRLPWLLRTSELDDSRIVDRLVSLGLREISVRKIRWITQGRLLIPSERESGEIASEGTIEAILIGQRRVVPVFQSKIEHGISQAHSPLGTNIDDEDP